MSSTPSLSPWSRRQVCKRAFDMMCERAKARKGAGGVPLAKKQMVQEKIARSWMELEQSRHGESVCTTRGTTEIRVRAVGIPPRVLHSVSRRPKGPTVGTEMY